MTQMKNLSEITNIELSVLDELVEVRALIDIPSLKPYRNWTKVSRFLYSGLIGVEMRELSPDISGSDFYVDLMKLINAYCKEGLSKPELVNKMKYATKSCELS